MSGSGWISSLAVCWLCGERWVATRPQGVEVLECPSCGEMMGAEDAEEVAR